MGFEHAPKERSPVSLPAQTSMPSDPVPSTQVARSVGRPRRAVIVLGLLVIVALSVALAVTFLGLSSRNDISAKDINTIANQRAKSAISQLQSQPPTALSAYRAVVASLVLIQSSTGSSGTEELGSGIIINSRGDILTALHVVAGASAIEITFDDGTTSAASITSADPSHDIAVLTSSHPPTVIRPAVLGNAPQIGDEAFAVGNPLGLAASLSAGVISGLDRTFMPANGRELSGMIQFDAAVNPGSSGGPLLNAKGQVIGIVTGLANPTGIDDFAGIGFAVPIATAGTAAGAPAK
jgi:S1-C subfamily serine protease